MHQHSSGRYVCIICDTVEAHTKQYSEFWNDTVVVESTWLALLLSICSLGAEIDAQANGDSTAQLRAEQLRTLTTHALNKTDTAKPQPHLIETLILHSLSYLFKHQDVTLRTWQLFGVVLRLCYQTGYHRDPGRSHKLSLLECEMRRRVWMVVQELEIGMSCNAGMVNFVDPKICDTALSSNVTDSDLSQNTLSLQIRPREESTLVQIAICY